MNLCCPVFTYHTPNDSPSSCSSVQLPMSSNHLWSTGSWRERWCYAKLLLCFPTGFCALWSPHGKLTLPWIMIHYQHKDVSGWVRNWIQVSWMLNLLSDNQIHLFLWTGAPTTNLQSHTRYRKIKIPLNSGYGVVPQLACVEAHQAYCFWTIPENELKAWFKLEGTAVLPQ